MFCTFLPNRENNGAVGVGFFSLGAPEIDSIYTVLYSGNRASLHISRKNIALRTIMGRIEEAIFVP